MSGAAAANPIVRIVTFNAGLHPDWFPFVPQRRRALVAALSALDADVVALQEVWMPDDREAVAARSGFGHVVAPDPLPPLADGWAAGGATGIMLLSRHPLASVDVLPLQSTLVRRALIRAELETPAPITVLATHLTAHLPQMQHPDPGGWEGEHRAQVAAILELVSGLSGAVVLAGDLNCGPETGSLDGAFSENYTALRAGFAVNPYLDRGPAPCTWCPDNPLVTFPATAVLDHVLANGLQPIDAARIFDEPLTLETEEGAVPTRLSDHYAVRVTFSGG